MPGEVNPLNSTEWIRWVWPVLIACAFCTVAAAGVHYDAQSNILWVIDYPRDTPCTPQRLWTADRLHGWGAVSRDMHTGRQYTVNAELRIGADNGTDTYFRIGNADPAPLTFVMNGDLRIMNSGNSVHGGTGVNALFVGAADDAPGKTTLLLAPEAGLLAGARRAGEGDSDRLKILPVSGLEITMNRATVSCAQQEAQFDRLWLKGARVDLCDVHVSRAQNGVYILGQQKSTVERVVFEDCGVALHHFWGRAGVTVRHCVFRKCEVALNAPNRIEVLDCLFEQNTRNWVVRNMDWLIFRDCGIHEPRGSNLFELGETAARLGWPSRMEFRVTLHVAVRDASGNPVPQSAVTARDSSGEITKRTVTDDNGRAPLVLPASRLTGTSIPNQPETREMTYELHVSAKGFSDSMLKGIDPKQCLAPLNITMDRRQ